VYLFLATRNGFSRTETVRILAVGLIDSELRRFVKKADLNDVVMTS
jgi:hypothetical protein